MQNPGSVFFSMVSCLSSSNAHVLAAQDIADLFIVEQRSVLFKKKRAGVYYQVSKIEAKPRVCLNMIIHDCKFFERLQNLRSV